MNKSLKYSPNAIKVGFADVSTYNNTTFADNLNLTVAQQKDIFYTEANKCRSNYKPMWDGEPQFLPSTSLPKGCKTKDCVDVKVTVTPITQTPTNVESLTKPPKLKDNTLVNLALAGIGIIVLIKILE